LAQTAFQKHILTPSAYNEFFPTFVVFLFDNPTRKFLTNQIAAFLKFGPIKLIYSEKMGAKFS
jgi:hypothetical protein